MDGIDGRVRGARAHLTCVSGFEWSGNPDTSHVSGFPFSFASLKSRNTGARVVIALLTALLAVGILAVPPAASVPSLMTYQGKLTSASSGGPISDGVHSVAFGLFAQSEGGTAMWTESRTVHTFGGVFTVLLGSMNPLPASAFSGDTWLETSIGGVTFSPRLQLVTAGYAHVAGVAESVTDSSITTNKIVDNAVTQDKLENYSIPRERLAADSITTPIIADNAITDSLLSADAKMALRKGVHAYESCFNVKEYGALGNGTTDDTAAFQSALNAAGAAKGGVVIVPTGGFRIAGHINIPSNVTIEGIAPAPPQKRGWWDVDTTKASILLAYEGEGNPSGTPFITLGQYNSGIKGLVIYYPSQLPTLETPVAFPWTIQAINAENASIIDCQIVNPYQCVNIDGGGKHCIRSLYGQPLYRGVVVDNCSDIRVKNVHFWPFNTAWMYPSQNTWQLNNGIAFIFKKCDWLFCTNTFVLGYSIGFQFAAGANGNTHGNLIGVGVDASSVDFKVDSCSTAGIMVVNGEFVGNQSPVAKPIIVGSGVGSGVLSLNNCSFWGASYRIADIGSGTVNFTNCHFSEYQSSTYAIYSTGGRVSVRNCYFSTSGYGVRAGAGTIGCLIMGNQGLSSSEILNEIGSACVIANNKS